MSRSYKDVPHRVRVIRQGFVEHYHAYAYRISDKAYRNVPDVDAKGKRKVRTETHEGVIGFDVYMAWLLFKSIRANSPGEARRQLKEILPMYGEGKTHLRVVPVTGTYTVSFNAIRAKHYADYVQPHECTDELVWEQFKKFRHKHEADGDALALCDPMLHHWDWPKGQSKAGKQNRLTHNRTQRRFNTHHIAQRYNNGEAYEEFEDFYDVKSW